MRKVIGVLLMVVIVGGFIVSIKSRGAGDKTGQIATQEVNTDKQISQIEEKIDTAYPEKAAEVIAAHNELMKILYGNVRTSDTLEDYVRTIRKLYSADFLNLNSYEKQFEDLKSEMSAIQSMNMDLVASEINDVYVLKDEEGKENKAEVNVKHTTNQGSINRTYFMVNEEGKWKINAWENEENTELTTETSSTK